MCADIQVFKNQLKDNGIKKLFSSLSLFQKITLGIVAVAVIAGLISLVKWADRPEYVALYNNLGYEEAAGIAAELDEAKIEYQLSENGDSIKVKKADLADARLTLASAGIMNNSIVGFELFDQQFFGLTDFTQRVNYQRALEGELSRTIAELEEVESARVHLVLASDELFTEESKGATASVVLKLQTGKTVGDSSVLAIKNLVANAVESLNTENISIVDTAGNLLTVGDVGTQRLSEQQKITEQIEKDLENKISAMLIKVVGANNSIVSVMAEINNNQREAESETYLPGEDGHGVALTSSKINETYNKAITGSEEDAEEAGTESNVPIAGQDSTEDIPQYGEVTGEESEESNVYNKSEEQTQYGVSRVVEKVKYGVGDIKKLSIGVFLNSEVSEDKMDDIESVIIAAAGIDESRGDILSIERMNFAEINPEEIMGEDGTQVPISTTILDIAKKALPGGLIVILLLLLTLRSMGLLKKKSVLSEKERKKLVDKIDSELNRLSDESGTQYDSLTDYESESAESKEKLLSPNFFAPRDERLSRDEKRKKIIEIRKKVLAKMDETMYAELKDVVSFESKENPQAAAKAIRNWLTGNV